MHIFAYTFQTSLAPMCIEYFCHSISLYLSIVTFFAHSPPMLVPQCISIPVYSLWLLYTLYICGHFSCFSRFVPLPLPQPMPPTLAPPLPLFLFCLCFMTDCLCSQRVRGICQVFFSIFIPSLLLLIHICIRFFCCCLSVCLRHSHSFSLYESRGRILQIINLRSDKKHLTIKFCSLISANMGKWKKENLMRQTACENVWGEARKKERERAQQ